VVRVASINCAGSDALIEFCGSAGIPSYPSIKVEYLSSYFLLQSFRSFFLSFLLISLFTYFKYYPASATEFGHAIDISQSRHTFSDVKDLLIDMIVEDYGKNHYRHWPNFDHLPECVIHI